jgi:primosomal protein N' (replication factor Y)
MTKKPAESNSRQKLIVADVVFDFRTAGTESVYTYEAEPGVLPGSAYLCGLGSRSIVGYVWRIREIAESELGFPRSQLRPLGTHQDALSLPPELFAVLDQISAEYLCPLPVALSAAAPPNARTRLKKVWKITELGRERLAQEKDSETIAEKLTATQLETLKAIGEKAEIREPASSPMSTQALRTLRLLRNKGFVEERSEIVPYQQTAEEKKLLRLAANEEEIERWLKQEGRRKPAQALVVAHLQEAPDTALSAQEIRTLCGVSAGILKQLVTAGILVPAEAAAILPLPPPQPNDHQQAAIDHVSEYIRNREPRTTLLYGVTGSGKTEVYLRLAAETLRQGRQVLYLVPEIALTAQVVGQLKNRFGSSVALLHSNLSVSERLENWRRIRCGEAPIALGARSAMFAPLDNVGLIILDEEHESTYKQETAPRYHTRRAAEFLAKQHSCPLVLGSATPSIETYYDAETGNIDLCTLPIRAASARLPDVYLHDLRNAYVQGTPTLFSDMLLDGMAEALEKDEQIILFLNRRAYAPAVVCRKCGYMAMCQRCDVTLSYHRFDHVLKCHQCGLESKVPEVCPNCESDRISVLGIGTQRVEEAIQNTFPTIPTRRLDRDVTQKKGALEEALTAFRSGDAKILIGTQMVAKGLDFPNVTLVGVVAADVGLHMPDFRATERTFQLLCQVSGRAGRGVKPGRVVVQTFNPESPVMKFAAEADYLGFYESEIEVRKRLGYPPFGRLVNIVGSSENRGHLRVRMRQVASSLDQSMPKVEMFGPSPCPIERLNDRYREHILLRLRHDVDLSPIREAVNNAKDEDVRITIDVDPHSML